MTITFDLGEEVTADVYMLNELALVYKEAAENMRRNGCPALAERYMNRSDEIAKKLYSKGAYDEFKIM
nr:MAG TPA: hypothetical protein [Caudoviricetes sp.]